MISCAPLFEYIDRHGISISDLCRMTGRTKGLFSQMRRGRANASASTLGEICSALHIGIGEAVRYIPDGTEVVNHDMEYRTAGSIDYSPLFAIMRKRGLSAYAAARGSGLSGKVFERMKKGSVCKKRSLLKIASFLGVAPMELYKVNPNGLSD